MVLTYAEYLAHYGVKGMKWGVRHDRQRTSRRKDRRSEERKQIDAIRKSKKKAKNMTNEELRQITQRLNMEAQYNRLNLEVNHPFLKLGKDVVTRKASTALSDLGDYIWWGPGGKPKKN